MASSKRVSSWSFLDLRIEIRELLSAVDWLLIGQILSRRARKGPHLESRRDDSHLPSDLCLLPLLLVLSINSKRFLPDDLCLSHISQRSHTVSRRSSG